MRKRSSLAIAIMNTENNTITSAPSTEGMYKFSPDTTIWLSLEDIVKSLNVIERIGLEITFYPAAQGTKSPTTYALGTFTLRTGSKVLLTVEGNILNFLVLAEALGFEQYEKDDLTFHYPHPKWRVETAPEASEVRRKRASEPVAIALESFEAFSTGGEIEHSVSAKLEPKAGDRIGWECGCNISGTLEVLAVGETDRGFVSCTLRRVS